MKHLKTYVLLLILILPTSAIVGQTLLETISNPNPITNISVLDFENTDCSVCTFIIYDKLGRKIIKEQSTTSQFTIKTQNLSSGTYIYVLARKGVIVYSDKFIVNK